MKFTLEELEIIKDALIVSLEHSDELNDESSVIKILDRIDEETENGFKGAVSGSRFQSAYAQYWDMVKDIVDEDGWVYTKEVPNMLDAYFESNTNKPIEFQKSFGKSGDNPHWLTKGSRWRPTELS